MSVLESYSSINIWDSSAITLNFSQESGIIKFSRPQQFKSGSLFGTRSFLSLYRSVTSQGFCLHFFKWLKPCFSLSGILVFKFRGRRCRVRKGRKYTIKLKGIRARIRRFRKRLRMRIGRTWCRIKRKAGRWRARIRRRWCRLKKRGRRWFYKRRRRWKRLRRVRVTIRIKRKRCRVRRRRGKWLLKYRNKWRKIKRKTLGYFRFKGRRKFVTLIGRRRMVYKRKTYRMKTKTIRRRRREYTELNAVVNNLLTAWKDLNSSRRPPCASPPRWVTHFIL